MAGLFSVMMFFGQLVGGHAGLMFGFLIALATNGIAYWFSDKIALATNQAQELTEAQAPELFGIVRRLAQQAGLPMPRVYRVPTRQPNAFATGRDPQHAAIAVTDGIWQMLSRDELEGVLAHELAHVKHRDTLITTVVATMAGAISFMAQILQFEAFFGGLGDRDNRGGNVIGLIAMMILAPIVALIIQLAISRSREFEADRGGALITGRPLALASALEKIENVAERAPLNVNPSYAHLFIVNPMGGDKLRWISALFRTHPLTQDRVARLEAMAAK
jgi:heat shock protein HtpX